jgi:predicted phosphohydrolase
MKIQVVSDIHIEKNPHSIKEIIKPSAKILCIAGDVGRIENFEKYLNVMKEICEMFETVFLIPGNHEYYTTDNNLSIPAVNNILKSLEIYCKNLMVLINEYKVIGDFVIFGSTFWSYCEPSNYTGLPIYLKKQKLTCRQYNALHIDSLKSIEMALEYAESTNKKLIVITHHSPSFKGTLAPKYINHRSNSLYCSNSEHIVNNKVIKIWIYGHTGYNGNIGKLVTNQIEHGGINNATLNIF